MVTVSKLRHYSRGEQTPKRAKELGGSSGSKARGWWFVIYLETSYKRSFPGSIPLNTLLPKQFFKFKWKDYKFRLLFHNFKVSNTWSNTVYTSNNEKVTSRKYTVHFFGSIYLGISELCLFQMALVDSKVCSAHGYRLHGEIQIWIQKESAKTIFEA